ncbi:unnamed protein product [Mesocestoides corti]|uniref:Uncharacterized protein n=1 Tax=Mesocestoides corti TaxID=53468 RepID=A0A0R3UMA5_MESCO|nr:unnamed protein product [Mesocestoides corti]
MIGNNSYFALPRSVARAFKQTRVTCHVATTRRACAGSQLALSCENRPGGQVRPSNTTGEDSSAKCRLSSIRPKPGYSGHLWQIANIVSASVLSKDLPPDVASKWDSFVQNDLEAINEAQRITEDEAVAENTDDRSPFALGSLRIGGAGCQMAELFKAGSSAHLTVTSGFRNGALGQGDGEEGAPRSDPNEDAFDDDDDVDGAEECEDHQAVEPNVSSDDEGAGGGGGGSDSSDEEILQSPLTIRQQRTNQAPATLHLPVNGIPFVKQMDACKASRLLFSLINSAYQVVHMCFQSLTILASNLHSSRHADDPFDGGPRRAVVKSAWAHNPNDLYRHPPPLPLPPVIGLRAVDIVWTPVLPPPLPQPPIRPPVSFPTPS